MDYSKAIDREEVRQKLWEALHNEELETLLGEELEAYTGKDSSDHPPAVLSWLAMTVLWVVAGLTGAYRGGQGVILAFVAGVIIYFLLPEPIPFVDDFAAIALALTMAEPQVRDFAAWCRKKQSITLFGKPVPDNVRSYILRMADTVLQHPLADTVKAVIGRS